VRGGSATSVLNAGIEEVMLDIGFECQHSKGSVRHRVSNAGIEEVMLDIDFRMPAFADRCPTSIFECRHSKISAELQLSNAASPEFAAMVQYVQCQHSKIDVGHRLANAGIQKSMSDISWRMLAFGR
jgi:hypothetical protein